MLSEIDFRSITYYGELHSSPAVWTVVPRLYSFGTLGEVRGRGLLTVFLLPLKLDSAGRYPLNVSVSHSNFLESILWNLVQMSCFWRLFYPRNSQFHLVPLAAATLWANAECSLGRKRNLHLSLIINNKNTDVTTRCDTDPTKGCANLGRRVPQATVAPNICGSSVRNLLHVTLPKPRVLGGFYFRKLVGPLHVRIVALGASFWNTAR